MVEPKYISVVDNEPCASKKGLRIKVVSICCDDSGNLLSIGFVYSMWRIRGFVYADISQKQPIKLLGVEYE